MQPALVYFTDQWIRIANWRWARDAADPCVQDCAVAIDALDWMTICILMPRSIQMGLFPLRSQSHLGRFRRNLGPNLLKPNHIGHTTYPPRTTSITATNS